MKAGSNEVQDRDQNRGNSQGKDYRGLEGYLEGIFGDPSLANIQEKALKKHKTSQEQPKKQKLRKLNVSVFSLALLCFDPRTLWSLVGTRTGPWSGP